MTAGTATIFEAVIGAGALIVIGATFLLLGDRGTDESSAKQGGFFARLHLVAIVAAIIGAMLAGLSFEMDHPRKWLHLALPFVFAAIVYGYALGFNRVTWESLRKDFRGRLAR